MCAELRAVLPRTLDAGAQARRLIEGTFAGEAGAGCVCDLQIAVSEMVNNAVVHGSGEIVLHAEIRQDVVHIEVSDEGLGTPAIRAQPDGDMGGWGMRIVDRLARAWGTSEAGSVWADLPVASGLRCPAATPAQPA
ncbi:MAG: ATP-binding protein [Solirubrobacteraceae bacterium]